MEALRWTLVKSRVSSDGGPPAVVPLRIEATSTGTTSAAVKGSSPEAAAPQELGIKQDQIVSCQGVAPASKLLRRLGRDTNTAQERSPVR